MQLLLTLQESCRALDNAVASAIRPSWIKPTLELIANRIRNRDESSAGRRARIAI